MAGLEGVELQNTFTSALRLQKEEINHRMRRRPLNDLLNEGSIHCLSGLKAEIKNLPKDKFARILDLGCGKGIAVKELQKKYSNWEIHGLDLLPEKPFPEKKDKTDYAFEKLIKRLKIEHLFKKKDPKTGKITQSEASLLPYKTNQFDLVYSKDAYPYFPDKIKAIIETLRITKPEGVILIQSSPGETYESIEDPAVAKELQNRGMAIESKLPGAPDGINQFKKIDIVKKLQAVGIKATRNNDTIHIRKHIGDDERSVNLPFEFISATNSPDFTDRDYIDSFYKPKQILTIKNL